MDAHLTPQVFCSSSSDRREVWKTDRLSEEENDDVRWGGRGKACVGFLSSLTNMSFPLPWPVDPLTSAACCHGNAAAAPESWVGESRGFYLVNRLTGPHRAEDLMWQSATRSPHNGRWENHSKHSELDNIPQQSLPGASPARDLLLLSLHSVTSLFTFSHTSTHTAHISPTNILNYSLTLMKVRAWLTHPLQVVNEL